MCLPWGLCDDMSSRSWEKTVINCDSLGCIKIETINTDKLIITRALGFGEALAQRATPFVTARQWSEGSVGTVWSRRSTPSASNFQSRKTHSESEPVLGHNEFISMKGHSDAEKR